MESHVILHNVPTHNSDIFVRPKKVSLFWEMSVFWKKTLYIHFLNKSSDNIRSFKAEKGVEFLSPTKLEKNRPSKG